ncbi:phytoene desaturase family protein [Nocardioides cynanchi]|uniref:phytoene desaturase family protein n=1 Tax=Nocardioides cynanchi TaxID=2558918 RepID=UPI00124669F9|nr:FAD-dependent oxidoreductase [Nocardioides cynanchi]
MARVVVIGGGLAGLACALRLAKTGHDVTLLEAGELGGALAPVVADGFEWDGSATHTLLPAVLRDLFRKTGRPLEKELELTQLDCLREHWFEDGSALVLPAGRAPQHDAVESLGAGLGRRWVDHVAAYADDWEALRLGFMEVPWTPEALPRPVAARLDSRESLQRRLRSLRDDRLRLVAGHPFTLDGHDLRQVPAWAGLTSYLEQRFGAWAVVGGMGLLRDALVRRLATRDVTVVGARAHDVIVRDGRAVGVATASGDLDADVVVCAMDPRRLPALASLVRRTMPALPPVVCHVGLEDPVRNLPHELVLHGDPTLVLRTGGRAPDGAAAWTVLGRGRVSEDLLTTLARRGIDVRPRVVTRVDRSPKDLVEAWRGTPLGIEWEGRGTVRRRLGPTTPVPGVYACGAHANPGSGLPYVGLSAALVAQVVGPA